MGAQLADSRRLPEGPAGAEGGEGGGLEGGFHPFSFPSLQPLLFKGGGGVGNGGKPQKSEVLGSPIRRVLSGKALASSESELLRSCRKSQTVSSQRSPRKSQTVSFRGVWSPGKSQTGAPRRSQTVSSQESPLKSAEHSASPKTCPLGKVLGSPRNSSELLSGAEFRGGPRTSPTGHAVGLQDFRECPRTSDDLPERTRFGTCEEFEDLRGLPCVDMVWDFRELPTSSEGFRSFFREDTV